MDNCNINIYRDKYHSASLAFSMAMKHKETEVSYLRDRVKVLTDAYLILRRNRPRVRYYCNGLLISVVLFSGAERLEIKPYGVNDEN